MGIPCQVAHSKQEKPLLKSTKYFSLIIYRFSHPDYPFTEKQVILSFGCSGSLYNAVAVLCERGDNILAPRPGFPLCLPIC